MASIEASVWIGCYATYNDGFLFDKQYVVSTPDELDDVLEKAEKHFLKSIKAAKPEWDKDGYIAEWYCEELYIAAFEVYVDDEFVELDTGESVGAMRDALTVLEGGFNYPVPLLVAIMNNCGAELDDLKKIDDEAFVLSVDSSSDSDLSCAYFDVCGGLEDMPELLQNYFDHHSHGQDLYCNGFNYYLVNNQGYAVEYLG